MTSVAPFRVVPRIRDKESAEGLCLRCGMKRSHLTWSECIDALRDTIAELEIRIVRLRSEKPARKVSSKAALHPSDELAIEGRAWADPDC
jgi:hypothetical protein